MIPVLAERAVERGPSSRFEMVATFVAAVVLSVSLAFLVCATPARGAEAIPIEIQQPGAVEAK